MKINYGRYYWATIVGCLFVGLGVWFALTGLHEFYLVRSELPFTGIAMFTVLLGWGTSLLIASRKKYIGSWRSPIGALLVGIAVVATGGAIDALIAGELSGNFVATIVVLLVAGISLIYTKMQLLHGLIVVVVLIINWWFWSIVYILTVQGTGPELVAALVIPETVCVNERFSVFIHTTNPHEEIIDFSNVGIPAPFLENFDVLSVWPDAEQLIVGQSWFYFEIPVEPGRTVEVEMEFMAQTAGTYTTHFEVCTMNAGAENCERIVRIIAVQPTTSC